MGVSIVGAVMDEECSVDRIGVVGSFGLASEARPLPHPKRLGLADAGESVGHVVAKQIISIC